MVPSFPESFSLLKLFYQNVNNAAKALPLYLGKNHCIPIVKRFLETASFAVQAGRGYKKQVAQVMDGVATAVVRQSNVNTAGSSSIRSLSWLLHLPYTTVWMCNKCAQYKIRRFHVLKPDDNGLRETFLWCSWHGGRWIRIGCGTSYGQTVLTFTCEHTEHRK